MTKVRSIFISDIHLGSRHCQADKLLEFLKAYQADNLYLVGDIIDGWKLKKGFYWNDNYSFIIHKFISYIKKEKTKIYYVAGNHDEFIRDFIPNQFGHLEIGNEFIHKTANGKKLLVIHGDCFDHMTKHFTALYHFGDKGYSLALNLNATLNYFRRKLGLKYWSLSKVLKYRVKEAVKYINNFEILIVKHTLQKGCDGVICGHIHTPIICDIENVKYYNCGDWVENCTALIEDYNGNIKLVEWN